MIFSPFHLIVLLAVLVLASTIVAAHGRSRRNHNPSSAMRPFGGLPGNLTVIPAGRGLSAAMFIAVPSHDKGTVRAAAITAIITAVSGYNVGKPNGGERIMPETQTLAVIVAAVAIVASAITQAVTITYGNRNSRRRATRRRPTRAQRSAVRNLQHAIDARLLSGPT